MVTISDEKATVLNDLAQNENVIDLRDVLGSMHEEDRGYYDYNSEFSGQSSDTLKSINNIIQNYESADIELSGDLIKLMSTMNNSLMKFSDESFAMGKRKGLPEKFAESITKFNKEFKKSYVKTSDTMDSLLRITTGIDRNTDIDELRATKNKLFDIMEVLDNTFEFLTKEHLYAMDENAKSMVHRIESLKPKFEDMTSKITQKMLSQKGLAEEIAKVDTKGDVKSEKVKKEIGEKVKSGNMNEASKILNDISKQLFNMNETESKTMDMINNVLDERPADTEFGNLISSKFSDILDDFAKKRQDVFSAEDNISNVEDTLKKLEAMKQIAEKNSNLFSDADMASMNEKYDIMIGHLSSLEKETKMSVKKDGKGLISSLLSGAGSFFDIPALSFLGDKIEEMTKKEEITDGATEELTKEVFGEIKNMTSDTDWIKNYYQANEKEDDREQNRNVTESNETQEELEDGFFGLRPAIDKIKGGAEDLKEKGSGIFDTLFGGLQSAFAGGIGGLVAGLVPALTTGFMAVAPVIIAGVLAFAAGALVVLAGKKFMDALSAMSITKANISVNEGSVDIASDNNIKNAKEEGTFDEARLIVRKEYKDKMLKEHSMDNMGMGAPLSEKALNDMADKFEKTTEFGNDIDKIVGKMHDVTAGIRDENFNIIPKDESPNIDATEPDLVSEKTINILSGQAQTDAMNEFYNLIKNNESDKTEMSSQVIPVFMPSQQPTPTGRPSRSEVIEEFDSDILITKIYETGLI